MRQIFTALAFALGAFTSAQAAEVFAAADLYAGPTQTTAVCYFFNAGKTIASLEYPEILNSLGTPLSLTVNQCGAIFVLGGGTTCGIAANIANDIYSCTVTVNSNKSLLRGNFQLRDRNQTTLQSVELR